MTKRVQKYPLAIVIVDEIVFINGKCYHKMKREKHKIKDSQKEKNIDCACDRRTTVEPPGHSGDDVFVFMIIILP